MAKRVKTEYELALTKYFMDFDRLKERFGRPPTAKELGPVPKPGKEDIEDASNYYTDSNKWRGARVNKEPTTYKVRHR